MKLTRRVRQLIALAIAMIFIVTGILQAVLGFELNQKMVSEVSFILLIIVAVMLLGGRNNNDSIKEEKQIEEKEDQEN